MHVRNALAYQLKGFGAIEEVEGLFVWYAHVLCDEPYDARVFPLEKCWIGLHGSKIYCLQETEGPVEYLLRSDAYLKVWFLPAQLIQRLVTGIYALQVKINRIEHPIIGDAARDYVVLRMGEDLYGRRL